MSVLRLCVVRLSLCDRSLFASVTGSGRRYCFGHAISAGTSLRVRRESDCYRGVVKSESNTSQVVRRCRPSPPPLVQLGRELHWRRLRLLLPRSAVNSNAIQALVEDLTDGVDGCAEARRHRSDAVVRKPKLHANRRVADPNVELLKDLDHGGRCNNQLIIRLNL